jgi:hypothetical protein
MDVVKYRAVPIAEVQWEAPADLTRVGANGPAVGVNPNQAVGRHALGEPGPRAGCGQLHEGGPAD